MNPSEDLSLERVKRIGIMGGTFDPVHFAHLFIAQTALDQLSLDKVIFIPTGKPPHKESKSITDSQNRLDMLALAIKSNPRFELSSIEITREKTTYTIDTVQELKNYYGEKTELYFITGTDAFIQIESWKNYAELLQAIKFVVMNREVGHNELLDQKISEFTQKYGSHIFKIEIPILEISSTDIRRRVKAGQSIKYLLPDHVEEYILSNGLYRD